MNIQVLSARKYNHKLKATIQVTGKLGFGDDVSQELKFLQSAVYIKFLKDSDNDMLYMVALYHVDADAFKVCKAGAYFYLNTSLLFKDLGIDYKEYNVIYDLSRCAEYDEEFGGKVYQMNPRVSKRRKEK